MSSSRIATLALLALAVAGVSRRAWAWPASSAAILHHGACREDDRFGVPIDKAAGRVDDKVDAKCPLDIQTSIGGYIGCATQTSDTAVDAVLAEEYGR